MPRVKRVFGRSMPHVIAEPGDYDSSMIENDSGVPGASVKDALAELNYEAGEKVTLAGDLYGTITEPRVGALYGKPVQNVQPNDGDYLFYSTARGRWEPRPRVRTKVTPYVWKQLYSLADAPAGSASGVGAATIGTLPVWVKGNTLEDVYHKVTVSWGSDSLNLATSYKGLSNSGSAKAGAFVWLPFTSLPGYVQGGPIMMRGTLTQAGPYMNYVENQQSQRGPASYGNVPASWWMGTYNNDASINYTDPTLFHGVQYASFRDKPADPTGTIPGIEIGPVYAGLSLGMPPYDNVIGKIPGGTTRSGSLPLCVQLFPGKITYHLDVDGAPPHELPYVTRQNVSFGLGLPASYPDAGAITQKIGMCFGHYFLYANDLHAAAHPSTSGSYVTLSKLRIYQLQPA